MAVAAGKSHARSLRDRVVGSDFQVPVLSGERVRYVNLDNAASTPPMKAVVQAIERFLPLYSSVHRGTGFKSRLSTKAYGDAHAIIGDFVGADPDLDTVIFGKNTTEAINKLAYRLPLGPDRVVITTELEHHSNDLPWRHRARVLHARVMASGALDLDHLESLISEHSRSLVLVAISGASNVTGYIQPVETIARWTHAAGAMLLVDAAQLAPHRAIDMRPHDDPAHIDFLALSAHKMYAPFGTGALIGPRSVFLEGPPEYRGGGTVDVVTLDEVEWAGMPDRDEAGSPNVVGAIAMAAAARQLMDIGMTTIAEHEQELVDYALQGLQAIPGIEIYGLADPLTGQDKVGVITFNIQGVSHFLVSSILGYEAGVGVRSGCFCAHPYVVQLLGLSADQTAAWRQEIAAGIKENMPGMVRISFGCYNSTEDVDRALGKLREISAGDYLGEYRVDPATGEYTPVGFEESFFDYFSLTG